MGEDKVGEECPPTVPGHRILSVCLIQKFSQELVSGTSHSSHSRSPAFGTMLRTAITAGEPMWAEGRDGLPMDSGWLDGEVRRVSRHIGCKSLSASAPHVAAGDHLESNGEAER